MHDLGIYAGQAGVYADKRRTGDLTPDGSGVAISVVHRGSSYPDDLTGDGLLYHYPRTNRSPAHDAGEIQSLKWARAFGLPLFTITPSAASERNRSVHLSWIEDVDDDNCLVLIAFGDSPGVGPLALTADRPFFLTATAEERRELRKVRVGQQRFAFDVLRRYGSRCAVCDLALAELLDAAHICAKGDDGSNDARNGLPLCVLHHRAYDRGYWAVDPQDAGLVSRSNGPALEDLRISRRSLRHLAALPHPAALEHAWSRFSRHR